MLFRIGPLFFLTSSKDKVKQADTETRGKYHEQNGATRTCSKIVGPMGKDDACRHIFMCCPITVI